MKKLIVLVAALTLLASQAFAINSYQVTGPVLAIKGTVITIQKGSEKWEIEAGSSVAVSSYKVGDTVTIKYTMSAVSVTPKVAAKVKSKSKK